MKYLFTIISLFSVVVLTAQRPDGGADIAAEQRALHILADYSDRFVVEPLSPESWLIRAWHPDAGLMPNRLLGTDHQLWMASEMLPTMHVSPPRFTDYNTLVLRVGDGSARLSISNGSACNHMLWNNCPAAYRDARTLSFPLPR